MQKKQIKNLNNFSASTYDLFDFGGYCYDWEDGRNDTDCLHHILGRVSNSPYNAAPLNNGRTHQPEGRKGLPAIHNAAVRAKYLKRTKRYLDLKDYKPTEKDKLFLKKYGKYYQ